jgi:hypothetical protein
MFAPSREQVRQFFFATWAKYRAGSSLQGLETLALEVILLHPEYHSDLETPERSTERDYTPEGGQTNPFLHLSLHLALEEQLSIDQPAGIRAAFDRVLRKSAQRHDALHAALECLGEMVWRSQRDGAAPDAQSYLECLQRR